MKENEVEENSRWTEEHALKAFKDRFGLPKKFLLTKALPRVRKVGPRVGKAIPYYRTFAVPLSRTRIQKVYLISTPLNLAVWI